MQVPWIDYTIWLNKFGNWANISIQFSSMITVKVHNLGVFTQSYYYHKSWEKVKYPRASHTKELWSIVSMFDTQLAIELQLMIYLSKFFIIRALVLLSSINSLGFVHAYDNIEWLQTIIQTKMAAQWWLFFLLTQICGATELLNCKYFDTPCDMPCDTPCDQEAIIAPCCDKPCVDRDVVQQTVCEGSNAEVEIVFKLPSAIRQSLPPGKIRVMHKEQTFIEGLEVHQDFFSNNDRAGRWTPSYKYEGQCIQVNVTISLVQKSDEFHLHFVLHGRSGELKTYPSQWFNVKDCTADTTAATDSADTTIASDFPDTTAATDSAVDGQEHEEL